MDFIATTDEVLWDHGRQEAYIVRRGSDEFSTGVERPEDADPQWMPVVAALPEDRVEGHRFLLGPERYEYQPDYDPDVVLRTYPDADFSPEAFLRYGELRVDQEARRVLADTDWMVIREIETGEAIPQSVRAARAAVREAAEVDRSRLYRASPAEFPEFTPVSVTKAGRELDGAVEEHHTSTRRNRPNLEGPDPTEEFPPLAGP